MNKVLPCVTVGLLVVLVAGVSILTGRLVSVENQLDKMKAEQSLTYGMVADQSASIETMKGSIEIMKGRVSGISATLLEMNPALASETSALKELLERNK